MSARAEARKVMADAARTYLRSEILLASDDEAIGLVFHLFRGRKTLAAARDGGRATRRAPESDMLCASVLAYHDRFPNRSWTWITDKVGQDVGISGKQVRRHASRADWRRTE